MQRRIQVKVWVTGAVQGAAFRSALQREAQRWGVRGWVRNLEDGRVESVMQAPESTINAMVGWCRGGPLKDFVEDVTVEKQPLEAFLGFDVRR